MYIRLLLAPQQEVSVSLLWQTFKRKTCKHRGGSRYDCSSINWKPGTQLTMRTFHVGGKHKLKKNPNYFSTKEKLNIINKNLIEDSKNIIVMGRNIQLSLEDESGRQLAIYKVNYGSKLFFKDGEQIDKGKKLLNGILTHYQLLLKLVE